MPEMKPPLASSDVAVYTVRSTAMCEDMHSCPGNPISKGAQVSTTCDTFSNIRIEVLGKLDCHTYIYLGYLGYHSAKNGFARVNF